MPEAHLVGGMLNGRRIEVDGYVDTMEVRLNTGHTLSDGIIPIYTTYLYEHKGDGEYHYIGDVNRKGDYPSFEHSDKREQDG